MDEIFEWPRPNLKAATAIGLVVPDDILRQAHLVIR
jgi:hypothetical protein